MRNDGTGVRVVCEYSADSMCSMCAYTVQRFHTCGFLRGGSGATNSEGDTPVLMETIEGVPLSTGDHLNTEGNRSGCICVCSG